jgi:hypothetical protein
MIDIMGNTAGGTEALSSVVTSQSVSNSAFGNHSLAANTTGSHNTAVGNWALAANTTDSASSAFGSNALARVASGAANDAFGYYALGMLADGTFNSGFGTWTLESLVSGRENTGFGTGALRLATTGSGNIAVGAWAGQNVTTGSDNILVGHQGTAADSAVVRIGTPGTHRATYVAGIAGTDLGATGMPVVVDAEGRLGTGGAVAAGLEAFAGRPQLAPITLPIAEPVVMSSVTLSPGSYVIFAKVEVGNGTGSAAVLVTCYLAGRAGTLDRSDTYLTAGRLQPGSVQTLPVQAAVALEQTQTVTLECISPTAEGFAQFPQLTAIRAGSVTFQ